MVTPTERLTYQEAEQRSAHIARWLLQEGIGKGSRVGLFFTNGVEWITWWLAVSRIGALAVPISTMYTPAEIAKVLRLADIGVLVAPSQVLDKDVADRFEAALPQLSGQRAGGLALPAAPYLRSIVLTGEADREWATRWDGETAAGVSNEVLAAVEDEVSAADLAIMVHTSGSTADPKGVLHTHGTVVRQTSTWAAAIDRSPGRRPRCGSCARCPSFGSAACWPRRGRCTNPSRLWSCRGSDAGTALDLVERERATGIVGWPAFTQRLREHPTFASRDLSSAPMLRDGPLDLAMIDVPDGFPIHRTMSETAGGFAFTDISIVDEHGAPVPTGATGELLVRGIGAMVGYNKRERWETFDADGWYHTEDRVYRRENDPRLFYVGRTSELIKTAGANVSPLEVEAVIEEFSDVAQCIVVGIDDPERGEEVCAVVVAAKATIDMPSLAARARNQLSTYKVPTRWAIATS